MSIQVSYVLSCDSCGFIGDEIASDWYVQDHTTDPVAEAQKQGYDMTDSGHWTCPDCEG